MKRGTKIVIGFISVVAVAGAIAGGITLAEPLSMKLGGLGPGRLGGAMIGAIFGGILMYTISGTRIFVVSRIYEARLNRLQSRLNHALHQAEESYEKQLKKTAEGDYEPRLNLAVAHLLKDEVEKSVQEFEQAHRLGADDPLFLNNVGVALARRGSIQQSAEMLQKAAAKNGHQQIPHINLAHLLSKVTFDQDQTMVERALDEVRKSIDLDGERPVHYNRMGVILVRAKRYDEALAQFQKAADLAGESKYQRADAENNIGIVHVLTGDLKTAANQFQHALRLDSGHGRALANLGILHLLEGDMTLALEELQNALRLDTRSAPVRANYGYGLCRNGAINEGVREFRESILLDPNNFEPYYNLGKIYLDEGIPEVAERNLSRAIQLNPRSWEVLVAVSAIRIQQNQIQQAIQLLENADKLAPNQPLIYMNLGVAVALDGDYPRAQELLQKAAELDEKNAEIHAHLGWVYLLQESVSLCSNELAVAIHLQDDVAAYHNNLGLCQIGQNELDLALQSFRRTQQLDSNLVQLHYHIGYAYALQKKLDQAIKEWEQSIKLEPATVDCFVNLGVAYYQKNNWDAAVVQFRHAIALRQNRMEDFSNLGLALAKQGMALRAASKNREDQRYKDSVERQKLAIDMFDRALALEPTNVMLHSNRGLACFFAHQPEEALAEWAEVSRLDPSYARRRGKAQQSEFDDTAIAFAPLNLLERASRIPPRTADFVYRLSSGYDTDEWDVLIEDETLKEVPDITRQTYQIQRTLQALRI